MSPPLDITENDLLVAVLGGVIVQPTTSEVREDVNTFKTILEASAQPELLITQDWFIVGARVSETRGSGNPFDDYSAWFEKIQPIRKEEWRAWRLRGMIALTTFNIPHNFDVLLPLLGFWSCDLNAFIFPLGMMTPTILDVAATTGLSSFGATVHPS